MDKYKHCQGCRASGEKVLNPHSSNLICLVAAYNINGDCPCTKCLVKTMCKDICDKFNLWGDDEYEV